MGPLLIVCILFSSRLFLIKRMDLQSYVIIVTVFFVSLGSLLFVNRQLRGGKEEEWYQQQQLRLKLYGNKKKFPPKKTANKKVYFTIIFANYSICQFLNLSIKSINCIIYLFTCSKIVAKRRPRKPSNKNKNTRLLKAKANRIAARRMRRLLQTLPKRMYQKFMLNSPKLKLLRQKRTPSTR